MPLTDEDLLAALIKLDHNEYLLAKPEGDAGPIDAVRLGKKVRVDPLPGRQVFHRNAIKHPTGQRIRWLVVKAEGPVSIYFTDEGVIVTSKDLNP